MALSSALESLPPALGWIYRGISEVFPDQPEAQDGEQNLVYRLINSDRPLRIKLGIDPTMTEIHLGHSIPVRKLRAFQDAGHTAVLIIGDFTARIGDPTGKSEVRRQLTQAEVQANAQTYLDQLRPILDFDTPGRLEIRYNSEWLSALDLGKIIELLGTMTVGQMLAKEGFADRYEKGNPVFLHEFLYPLMQGYDSVAVQSDVELGGTDQKFNIAVGRDLQRHFGQSPQFGMLLPLLLGTDGHQKMSKSLGNYIGLQEDPLTMYSKLEKIPDTLIQNYFELLTTTDLANLPAHPRDQQKQLALTVTAQFHGPEVAQQAQQAALTLVQGGGEGAAGVPEFSLATISFPAKMFYLVAATGLCATSSEARRQMQGGGVKLEGEKIADPDQLVENATTLAGKVLQVGKKKFVRLVM
ncbi:MAG: tyrosine--tRNA ligase [Cyanobacteria bacterium REEB459]|nr:tyrosine--tRNA ligase [Cyanobacteria bacterium REEB459]